MSDTKSEAPKKETRKQQGKPETAEKPAGSALNGGKPASPSGNKAPQKPTQAVEESSPRPAASTLAHTLGEIVWLMTRSPLHKHLKLGDLEWLLMPAILMNQFRLFKVGNQVVGLALWAYITPEQAAEMGKTGKLKAEDWRHGTDVLQFVKDQQAGKKPKLAEPKLKDGEVELWLVDFVVPFVTPENKLAQACMADLIKGPLKGKKLRMHKTDPKTGEKTTMELGEG